jgi:hypothetical protein
MPHHVKAAFLSVDPTEPVLVFKSSYDAREFQKECPIGRIFPGHQDWVYLPKPQGLIRVRTAKYGDTGFVFSKPADAAAWSKEIKEVGRPYKDSSNERHQRTVYIGERKVIV